MSLPALFPKNPVLPGDVASFGMKSVPSKSMAVVTTTAYDLTDRANGIAPCATEFYCTTAGNLVAVLAGDGVTTRTYAVVAKDVVKGMFIGIDSSSTAVGVMRQ